MLIETYQMTSDRRKIGKSLSNQINYDGVPITPIDMINPKFILSTSSDVFNANYIFVDTFKKYYFIDNYEIDKAGRIIIYCSLDVLETHKNNLLASEQLIIRNEKIGSTFIADDMLPLKPYKNMKVIEFSNSDFNLNSATSNDYNFVLNVAGGGSGQTTTTAESEG